jgi:hypothetical protein
VGAKCGITHERLNIQSLLSDKQQIEELMLLYADALYDKFHIVKPFSENLIELFVNPFSLIILQIKEK